MSAVLDRPIPVVKTEPWAHQVEAYWKMAPLRGGMLALGMGAGKSRCTIDLLQNRGHQTTVIACPKSVVANWDSEFSKHAAIPFHVVTLRKGTIRKRTDEARQALAQSRARGVPLVLVINHEAVWRTPFAEFLATAGIDCVVVDESHRLKQPGGRFSLFMSRLAARVPYRLALTGTPMGQSPLDIYGQYRFVDKRIYGTSFAKFRAKYAVMGGYEGHQVIGYQNEAELMARFRSIAYVVGDEVLDLPETIDTYRTFELSPKARRVYRDLDRELFAEIDKGTITAQNCMVKLLRLQQVTSGTVSDDDRNRTTIDSGKRQLLEEVLEDLPTNEPVVVFCRFHSDLDAIHQAAATTRRTSAELSGRRDQLDLWQRGQAPVLAAQIQAGGVGVNLTRARYCCYFSLGFSLTDYLQSRKRTHRPGQTRTVNYIHLLAEQTVDQRVYRALARRQDVIDALMRGDA